MVLRSRAVSPAQKESRRDAIVEAAGEALDRGDYAAVRMQGVARAAGLAKGTVYLYFGSKEALFLALIERELGAWFDAVDAGLAGAAAGDAAVIEVLTSALAVQPRLPRLLAILHTVLEHNIDFDTAYRFKAMLRRRCQETGAALEGALPRLPPGDGVTLILRMHALVIGLEHGARPAPVVSEVLARPEMALFRVNLLPAFSETLRVLLAGWSTQGEKANV